MTNNTALPANEENTELGRQYDTPLGLAHTTMQALKGRIKQHYDLASDYYLNLWYVGIDPVYGVNLGSNNPLSLLGAYTNRSVREVTSCSDDRALQGASTFIMATGLPMSPKPESQKKPPKST